MGTVPPKPVLRQSKKPDVLKSEHPTNMSKHDTILTVCEDCGGEYYRGKEHSCYGGQSNKAFIALMQALEREVANRQESRGYCE